MRILKLFASSHICDFITHRNRLEYTYNKYVSNRFGGPRTGRKNCNKRPPTDPQIHHILRWIARNLTLLFWLDFNTIIWPRYGGISFLIDVREANTGASFNEILRGSFHILKRTLQWNTNLNWSFLQFCIILKSTLCF